MKATGIVRRIDDLGRVVIPKEIRRTMRIREGDPLQMTLTQEEQFLEAMFTLENRLKQRIFGKNRHFEFRYSCSDDYINPDIAFYGVGVYLHIVDFIMNF